VGPPALALNIGQAIHQAFDAQAAGEDPLDSVARYFDETEERIRREYQAIVGTGVSDVELLQLREARDLSEKLVFLYYERWGWENPLGTNWRYVDTEVTFKVPIPRTRGYLAGTFDGVVEHLPTETFWLMEHKTYSQTPKETDLQVHMQLTLYCWAAERLFGTPVQGVLYDGIGKKLAKTKEKQDERFLRLKIRIPQESIDLWNKMLPQVYREMASPKTPIIPNFRWEGCWDCQVRDLCHAIQLGDDVEYVMRGYQRAEGHRTIRSLLRPTRTVSRVTDIKKGQEVA
jgi:hypothetical protein